MDKKGGKTNCLISLALVVVGIALIAYGYASYYVAVCNCPNQAVGQPVRLCHCVNNAAELSLEIGALFAAIGIVVALLGKYAGSLARRKR